MAWLGFQCLYGSYIEKTEERNCRYTFTEV